MTPTDLRVFLASWFRSPLSVGALVPSGRLLAQALAAQVDPRQEGAVLELGPGTGAVTQALLARGVEPTRLVLLERDPAFCRLLRNKLPAVRVLQADARYLHRALADFGIKELDAVVSSLPLLSLPFTAQHQVVKQSFRALGPQGIFVQFTYGFSSPIRPELQHRLALKGRPVMRVIRNLPPAVVWRYVRSEPAAARLAA
jgi:phosphatidylethanolamine/phosphatidyl-N-methylethanolamine N-methyltransferase